jgi:hypothetical protein
MTTLKISPAYREKLSDILSHYRELADWNQHTDAAVFLIQKFGLPDEISEAEAIQERQYSRGYAIESESKRLTDIVRPYYAMLLRYVNTYPG